MAWFTDLFLAFSWQMLNSFCVSLHYVAGDKILEC